MKRAVYALVSGSYDEYQIHCLYETREDAQAAVDRMTGPGVAPYYKDPDVEEYDMYSNGDVSFGALPQWQAQCIVRTDGTIEPGDPTWLHFKACDQERVLDDRPLFFHEGEGRIYVNVGAPDRAEAEKAARDRAAVVAARLAEGVDPCEVVERGR